MNDPALTLSVVIPVYNGANTIGELVGALARTCPTPLTLVNLSRNYGEHNAVMAGLRHARGAWVITMDDDLQNPPGEILRLLDYARQSGKEAIYTRYGAKRHAAWRNIGSRFTNRVADWLLDKPKGLYLSSFRCLSAFVVG